MGDFDDAIREHLELKRKHGASEEEVTLKEREAQKQGALPSDPGAAPADELSDATPVEEAEAAATEDVPEAVPVDLDELDEPEVAGASAPPPPPLPDERDPDEVLAADALEVDVPPLEEPEDVLEETPEFLEEMPEQDRLWFEQKPPKDFDFDD